MVTKINCDNNSNIFLQIERYVLVGGMGGFGRSIATWIVQKGAKKLAFISRSGDSTPQAKQLVYT